MYVRLFTTVLPAVNPVIVVVPALRAPLIVVPPVTFKLVPLMPDAFKPAKLVPPLTVKLEAFTPARVEVPVLVNDVTVAPAIVLSPLTVSKDRVEAPALSVPVTAVLCNALVPVTDSELRVLAPAESVVVTIALFVVITSLIFASNVESVPDNVELTAVELPLKASDGAVNAPVKLPVDPEIVLAMIGPVVNVLVEAMVTLSENDPVVADKPFSVVAPLADIVPVFNVVADNVGIVPLPVTLSVGTLSTFDPVSETFALNVDAAFAVSTPPTVVAP